MAEQLNLSGYSNTKEVLAQRYKKGPRWVYVIAMPLHLVPSHLPVPDPEERFPGNRRVQKRHAEKFGKYWRDNTKWATPPLLLDTTYPLATDFQAKYVVAGVEVGILHLPHNSASELDILDGQHRTLGWKLVADDIAQDLKHARTNLLGSKEAGDEVGIAHWEGRVSTFEADQNRLQNEYATLEIMEGITLEDHKQIFTDIAVNAKGISRSFTTSFDRRSKLNRVAVDLAETTDLLVGRVDFEKDRVTGNNENLVSGINVVDIVRHVAVGIDGRWTNRRESDMKESAVADMAEQFLKALVDTFDDLGKIAEDDSTPAELRSKSLLGSVTILRVLAGVYHTLAVDLSDDTRPHITTKGDKAARALFTELNEHMGFPIEDGWWDTGVFDERTSKAPGSRAQQVKSLANTVSSWAADGTPF